jgi:hypothetical protein
MCAACDLTGAHPKFWLRGLCEESMLDRQYTLQQPTDNFTDKIYFKGKSSSIIAWVGLDK